MSLIKADPRTVEERPRLLRLKFSFCIFWICPLWGLRNVDVDPGTFGNTYFNFLFFKKQFIRCRDIFISGVSKSIYRVE